MTRCIPLLLMLTTTLASAQVAPDPLDGWPEKERQALVDSLHTLNMRPADLGYAKGPPSIDDRYRLELVRQLLHAPLSIPGAANRLLAPVRAGRAPSAQLAALVDLMQGGKSASAAGIEVSAHDLSKAQREGLPAGMAPIVAQLAGCWLTARKERQAALAAIAPELRTRLERQALALAVEEGELGLALEGDAAPLWAALDQVAWARLWRSGLLVQLGIERAVSALADLPGAANWQGALRVELDGGALVIAGTGADSHREPAGLIIDLGGDDLYRGEAAEAWIADLAGDDIYRGGNGSLACGVLDVRVVWDRAGDDDYRGEAASQGFGAFGIGLLVDEAGDDSYRAALYAQGASRTWGAGVLADRAGKDLYQVGGAVIHKPLLERERATFGFGQGFSIGYRGGRRSGGLACLWDGAGDDTYVGGTYTQGASYWFSLGLLIDDAGNDRYTAFYYSQGSAMHLCVAALIDGAGHDLYASHKGATHAIGHDWGVALIWDKGAGDDVYAGPASAATGVANGVGVFVDSGGNDRYTGPPATSHNARSSGSVALFLDMGGKDRYGRGPRDGGTAIASGRWRVARDLGQPAPPLGSEASKPVKPASKKPHPRTQHGEIGSRALGSAEELERLYSEASLWAVGSTRDRAWTARATLIEMGLEAARWMVEHKLSAARGLNLEAFVNVMLELGAEPCGALLLPALGSDDEGARTSALYLVGKLRCQVAGPAVIKLLADPKLARRSIAAAGALELKAAVPVLVELAGKPAFGPFADLVIAKALGQIADPAAIPWLLASLSGELPIREAAADALVRIGAPALGPLIAAAAGQRSVPARLALRALGQLDRAEALPVLRERAADADWGVRLTALLALRRMKAEGADAVFREASAAERDERVKRALAGLDPDERW